MTTSRARLPWHLDVVSAALGLLVVAGLVWAVFVVTSGGITLVEPIRFSSREPVRALLVSLGALALLALWSRYRAGPNAGAGLWRVFDSLAARVEHAAPWLVLGLACVVALQAMARGSAAAGGADSSGYISQADLMTRGTLEIDQPLARAVPWPFADATFSPLGYQPTDRPGVMVPTYSPGLPLVMALFQLGGGRRAVFLVVPVLAALAIVATYLLGARLAGRGTGLVAAAWLAASPAFVFSSLWPMSDVPGTAWWLLVALALTHPSLGATALGGVAGALAILTRPNLVLLAVPFGIHLLLRRRDIGLRGALIHAATFAAAIVPACLVIAWLNHHLRGSVLQSGYGSLHELYSLGHIRPFLERYPAWMASTQSPLIFACAAAPWVSARWRDAHAAGRTPLVWLGLTFSSLMWASYLFYIPFDEWWYLRFLLPAFPMMICLSVYVAHSVARRLAGQRGTRVAIAGAVLFLAWELGRATDLTRNGVRDLEHRYQAVGDYVARELPDGAVLMSMQHSGSLRYYSGRPILRYDWLQPGQLAGVMAFLASQGHDVFIVLDDWEEPAFGQRFAASDELGRLDWPPMAEYRQPDVTVVRVYDPRDRPAYRAGAKVTTREIPVRTFVTSRRRQP